MPADPTNPQTPPSRPVLLVVDDEPSFHETVAHYFDSVWELQPAFTVWQALEAAAGRSFTGAIVDLNLPDGPSFSAENPLGGGFAVVAALRANQPSCPVVVMTGLIVPWIVDASFRLGATLLSKSDFGTSLPSLSTWFLAKARGEDPLVATAVTRFVEQHGLSRRYVEVLNAALEDPTRKGISEMLDISLETTRDYTRRLIRCGQVQTLQELITRLRRGEVPPESSLLPP